MVSTSIAFSEDADAGPTSGEGGTVIEVDTKFGTIRFDPDKAVTIPQGILGFPGFTRYGLATLPDQRFGQFMILQSLENEELCFPVLPLEMIPGVLQPEHLEEAFEALSMPTENTVVLLIVTVRKIDDKVSLSANLRAPIFVETSSQTGRQFVLPHAIYEVRHQL